MSDTYVQHQSGQGAKWKLEGCDNHEYAWRSICDEPGYGNYFVYLPKSEYVVVPAPEVWMNVSDEVDYRRVSSEVSGLFHKGQQIVVGNGYRMRLVQVNFKAQLNTPSQWAFLVEKRQP